MKISFNWLKDYINIDLTADQVSEIFTNTGLEVEGVEQYESIKGGLKGFVIGEVLTCARHPNADKLSVTTVNIGGDSTLPIVCGAPNVAAGQKVIVATVGTTIYTSEGEFVIKKAKLRGEPSEGMICAEDEMGMGTSHDGIMVLPNETVPGTLASDYFNIENDVVFEIGLTPNRIDGASHVGVARDLVAYLNQSSQIELKKPTVSEFKVDNNNLPISVELKDTDACPRYSGVTISGLNVKESPDWLKARLKAIGLNPINNIVDITNFVLHELGHPLHAFDADKISGGKIVVRTCDEGTNFKTLDEEDRKLTATDLMICDAEKPACIGGVFGGYDSGVTESTKNIFLECAYFNPVSIRKSAKYHGLSTDSSFRFERGVDPNDTIYVLKRAALLIKELAGGEITSDIVDVYPKTIEPVRIKLFYTNFDRLIGKALDRSVIENILLSLDFEILDKVEEGLMVAVPTYRVDVTREADVIEEVLRVYGYNNVEIPTKVNASLSVAKKPDNEKIVSIVSDFLSSAGYNEIMSNSLSSESYYDGLTTFPSDKLVKLLNPLSADLNIMRQTLLFSGLETIAYNSNRQNANLALYEYGNVYAMGDIDSDDVAKKYSQEPKIGLFLTGLKAEPNWATPSEDSSYFNIKSTLENTLTRLGFDLNKIQLKKAEGKSDIYSTAISYIDNTKEIAEIGIVNKKILKKFDIDKAVFYAEINWGVVLKKLKSHKTEFALIPKFPEVKRDLSMILDQSIEFEELKQTAFKSEKKLLKQVEIFDVYQGDNIPKGKKSYALSFVLQDETATLKDKQIDKVMSNLIRVYTKQYNAEIRQ